MIDPEDISLRAVSLGGANQISISSIGCLHLDQKGKLHG